MRCLKPAAGEGFRALQLKIGYPDVAGDVEVIRAARDAADHAEGARTPLRMGENW